MIEQKDIDKLKEALKTSSQEGFKAVMQANKDLKVVRNPIEPVTTEPEVKKEHFEPEIVKESTKFFDNRLRKAKIICNVWLLGKDGARDKLVGTTKRKIGKTDFVIKGKRYWINYDELKEGKKSYTYDCDVTNAIGTLSFHDRSDRKVLPNQADDMLRDGVVRVLMGKGGIPAVYLLVAFIVVGIALAGMMYFLSQYQTLTKQVEDLKLKVTNLTNENQLLKTENENLKNQLPPIIGSPQ